jgi:hypothetical protein
MEKLGTEKVLMDERTGHADGSMWALHVHVTSMRSRLCSNLTGLWEASLNARRALYPRSAVAVLDRLLQSRA